MNDITLSIVSHGHGALLLRLLGDIARCASLSQATIIVTLNISEKFDAAAFAPLKIIVVNNARRQGFSANHNGAFRLSDTTWFAVLNPDLRLPTDPFPGLFEVAGRWPNVAVIAPTVLGSNGAREDAVRLNLTPASLVWRRLGDDRGQVNTAVPAQPGAPFYWLAGMFLLVRSSVYRELGGFDERFFLYCEDYDFCARAYLAGHGLAVCSEASVVHEAQRSSHRSARHFAWHLASLLKVWSSPPVWRLSLSEVGASTRGSQFGRENK